MRASRAVVYFFFSRAQCHADVLDLDWSPDSRFIAAASKDIVARCALCEKVCIPAFKPTLLAPYFIPRVFLLNPFTPILPNPPPLPCFIPRVFSLNPFKGYEPPVLAGHRDGIVSVFFSGEAMRKAAQVWRARRAEGDGPLHCSVYGGRRHCQ